MLAYLVLLHDPDPPPFIGIEEPENFLHPRLLPELAEECRAAVDGTQLLVTTHSPFFVNGLASRGSSSGACTATERGYTAGALRAADMRGRPRSSWQEGGELRRALDGGILRGGRPARQPLAAPSRTVRNPKTAEQQRANLSYAH